MNPIPAAVIENVFRELAEMSLDDADRIVQQMQEQQPDLWDFLLQTGDDTFDESERQALVNQGIFVWQMMGRGGSARWSRLQPCRSTTRRTCRLRESFRKVRGRERGHR